jgi:hypothetical protein
MEVQLPTTFRPSFESSHPTEGAGFPGPRLRFMPCGTFFSRAWLKVMSNAPRADTAIDEAERS